jgi:hypothetical protein
LNSLKEKLEVLGLELPFISTPGGNYVSVNIRGKIAYVAIQFPIRNEAFLYQGRLGTDVSTEEGYKAMELCALNAIAQIDAKVGLDHIEGLNHLDITYQSSEDWDDGPMVANGASNLFVELLGDKGRHSRAIFASHKLPRNFSVGMTCSFTLL